jgi:hypothetical protein
MKAVKKRLLLAREKCTDILSILNAKSKGADLTEYIMTIKFVLGVIGEFFGVKDKYRPKLSDDGEKISKLAEEYAEILTQLVKTGILFSFFGIKKTLTGKFLRYFGSNRVSQKFSQMNCELWK